VYTDASTKQLGTFIMQEGKPLDFYSIKLSSAQITTGEQELLSIVEILKDIFILFANLVISDSGPLLNSL
jgi:hypothetical protein